MQDYIDIKNSTTTNEIYNQNAIRNRKIENNYVC